MQPLSWLYRSVMALRNFCYDHQYLKSIELVVPVLSIGNLTVGGTGKSPMTDFLLSRLIAEGKRPGVVLRSYGGTLQSPRRVQEDNSMGAFLFGDEAFWLAKKYPQIPVWSGPKKWQTAIALLQNEKVDLVVVDDGFQHRGLARNCDLLLIDATQAIETYHCLPAGRGREDFQGWRRASAILLTKTNLASEENLKNLRLIFAQQKPVFEFASRLQGVAFSPGQKVLLVSGVAQPESFRLLFVEKNPGVEVHEMIFKDHHPFSEEDCFRIRDKAQQLQANAIVVTEKDHIKLGALKNSKELNLVVAPLVFQQVAGGDLIREVLHELVR